jgi:hypothetical protein
VSDPDRPLRWYAGPAVGFNAMQPGKVKPADLALFLGALAVVVALVVWAVAG